MIKSSPRLVSGQSGRAKCEDREGILSLLRENGGSSRILSACFDCPKLDMVVACLDREGQHQPI